jgi:hypothetical protein
MGGAVKKITKAIGISGGGGGSVKIPALPDYTAEREKAEAEALKNRSRLKAAGMSGTIAGGSLGDESAVQRKKLLGE